MIINFYSPDGRYDDIYLSNFALINVKDELLRVDGVSDISILGERDYSIRAWLDPQKLASRNMTAIDVANADPQPEHRGAAGQVGSRRCGAARRFSCRSTRWAGSRDPEQFGDIIVKVARQPVRSRPLPESRAVSQGSGFPAPASRIRSRWRSP